ncbi:hypothetical protein [Actinomadura coerulea]|uniref:hypothetical protein n=1 Tax=Actinomadura coerulea TaxID=46159 RepID=UPI0034457491
MTRFRQAGSSPDPGTLRAPRVLLPVLWWRDVSLTVAEPVELSPLDVFLVEAVTLRGRLDAEDFHTYTGLPARVFGGLARRLWNLDLVNLSDGVATPVQDGHRRAAEGTAAKTSTITKDLLFLPHTDDLVVVDGGLGDFERALPRRVGAQASLPERLAGQTRDAFLGQRFAAGTVVNMPPQVRGVAPDSATDEPLHAMAGAEGRFPIPLVPAIECTVTVDHRADPARVMLDVLSKGKGGSVAVNLGPARGIIADLDEVDALLSTAPQLPGFTTHTSGDLRREGPGRWSIPITGRDAEALTAKGSLTRPAGIEIRTEPDRVRLLTCVELRAADPVAERLLTRDAFIDTLLANPDNVVPLMNRRPPGDEVGLRRRAWDLGHYWIVHALREHEDFAYA